MSREAMAMALDVLENYAPQHGEPEDICEAIDALRDALAEAEKAEPVAWQARQFFAEDNDWSGWSHVDAAHVEIRQRYPNPHIQLRALYAHPPAALPKPTAWRIYDHESALGGGIWITDSERDAVEAKQAGCVVIGLVEQQDILAAAMSLREAAQSALATLRDCAYDEEGVCINPDAEDAYEALRDALAEAHPPAALPESALAELSDEQMRTLLRECRRWIDDPRLYADELSARRRSETKQEHEDRVSSDMEANCNRAELLERIDAVLAAARGKG